MIFKIFGIATKGPKGERKVNEYLRDLTTDDNFILIQDIIISNSVTGLSQIDHIVIGQAGIFVVETKNYSGCLSGGLYDKNLRKNGRKIHNPVCQNFGHVKAVESILDKHGFDLPVFSIVTFPRTLSFRIKGSTKNTRIVYWDETGNCIQALSENKLLDYEQMKNIHDILLSENRNSFLDRINHTFNLLRKKLGRK